MDQLKEKLKIVRAKCDRFPVLQQVEASNLLSCFILHDKDASQANRVASLDLNKSVRFGVRIYGLGLG